MRALLRVLALALCAAAAAAGAQPYPARPIRVIVPYAPGGATDVILRLLAPRLAEELGQPVLVENRPGAASIVGLELVAKAPPDGYTVGISNIAYGANPTLYRKMPFDAEKDLLPVVRIAVVTMVLSVHPSVPARTVKQLITLDRARPGTLTYGSAGNGSANHLATERFKHMTGTKMVHVPYKGGGPAVVALLAGETGMLFATIPSSLQHFKTGRLVALGVSSARRSAALPEVPTVAEAGVPGYEAIEWQGAMVPAGTAPQVVGRLNQAFNRVMAGAELRERVSALGAEFSGGTTEEFAAFIRRELATWSRVVKEVGLRID